MKSLSIISQSSVDTLVVQCAWSVMCSWTHVGTMTHLRLAVMTGWKLQVPCILSNLQDPQLIRETLVLTDNIFRSKPGKCHGYQMLNSFMCYCYKHGLWLHTIYRTSFHEPRICIVSRHSMEDAWNLDDRSPNYRPVMLRRFQDIGSTLRPHQQTSCNCMFANVLFLCFQRFLHLIWLPITSPKSVQPTSHHSPQTAPTCSYNLSNILLNMSPQTSTYLASVEHRNLLLAGCTVRILGFFSRNSRFPPVWERSWRRFPTWLTVCHLCGSSWCPVMVNNFIETT